MSRSSIWPEPHRVAILAFHEAKAGNATPQDVEEAEYQAIETSLRYLGKPENAELEFVYAITSFGTKGRAWKYERGMDYLTALFGPESLAERGDYIELHSSEARHLKAAFTMRNVKPYTLSN
ncbi:hypothetical protein BDV30DRAFT_241221 [Aspergillus minisclerotigenes]|uniref:Uncharacterized protein n=1 Tax=Aspergillus minisclerotigenes TaxID=656917 RepID=A0A5N6IWJ0_9EURO|nr:hypothetical protein BDV30DRAFT_241221 [Aspergillus minisclerotigenes]